MASLPARTLFTPRGVHQPRTKGTAQKRIPQRAGTRNVRGQVASIVLSQETSSMNFTTN